MAHLSLQSSEFDLAVAIATYAEIPIGGTGVQWRVSFTGGTAAAIITFHAQLLESDNLGAEGQRAGAVAALSRQVVLDANGAGSIKITTSDQTIYKLKASANFTVTVSVSPMGEGHSDDDSTAGDEDGNVAAAANFANDNRVVRTDGTGTGVQSSSWSLLDDGTLSFVGTATEPLQVEVVGEFDKAIQGRTTTTTGWGVLGQADGAGGVGLVAWNTTDTAYAFSLYNHLSFHAYFNFVGDADRTWHVPNDNASPNIMASRGWVETLGMPQNSRSAAYTVAASDNGKHILHPSADTTARTFTIDSNANLPLPIGFRLTIVNQNGAGVITIAITTDTMRLSPGGTTGSRTLAANGVATAIKVTATEWIIYGTGLT